MALRRTSEGLEPAREEDWDELREFQCLATSASAGDPDVYEWATARLNALLAKPMQQQVQLQEIAGVGWVVLVEVAALPEAMSSDELLQRVHLCEIDEALRTGREVPAAVSDEYRATVKRLTADPGSQPHQTPR